MPVRIVTDSAASLPAEVRQVHGITVIPLHVLFGATDCLEDQDLSAKEFYRQLESRPEHPTTSQPTPAAFLEAYRSLEGDDPIVSLHVSGALSGTIASARQAAAQLPEREIHVVDSRTVSMSLGLLALEAARAAEEGADAASVVARVEEMARRTYLAFVVQTLEYLRRGGRIGGAQAFLGSLLNVKPVLHVSDGRVEPLTRARSLAKACRAVLSHVREVAPAGIEHVALLHADSDANRALLEAEVLDHVSPSGEVFRDVIMGPVIGVHVGRGSVGFAFTARP